MRNLGQLLAAKEKRRSKITHAYCGEAQLEVVVDAGADVVLVVVPFVVEVDRVVVLVVLALVVLLEVPPPDEPRNTSAFRSGRRMSHVRSPPAPATEVVKLPLST